MLEPGVQADLATFRIPNSDDPEAALVRDAGCQTLDAVMAGGEWRVRDGELLTDLGADEAVARAARERAQRALA